MSVRVELYDGATLAGAATRRDVDLLSVPVAGDTFGAMVLHPSHETCPPIHHVEHYPSPTWRESEPAAAPTSSPPEAVVVVHAAWSDAQVLLEYDLHGWDVNDFTRRA
ncbi:hypothetical protein WDV86_01965 [Pseudokineococcus sp. 1T1Z-3]